MIVFLLLGVPLAGAIVSTLAARRGEGLRDGIFLAELIAVFALAAAGFARGDASAAVPGLCGMGLSFRMDGFRGLYALIAAFMWLTTGLLSREYFARYRNRTRYYLFNQITLMATLGVFLSDDLYTTFVFFEIMSLSSYPWVAHDETRDAMAAGRTYLAIAVFGGMVTLMGLFMAWNRLGALDFASLAAARGRGDMALPSALILVGFAAKAGLFPLHVWLPKAHPVAPAPASALLSGVLTKTGVFGMLIVALRPMLGVEAFGNALLALGLTTMLLGAVLALLSTNLKRVLACSSMSQIGYITVGVAMAALLGEEGGVPVSGAVMHMVNHSLLKLTLFMAAGVVYMNLHKLELDDIRGFGRGKPMLHAAFLLGALGLSGVPGFNGYVGKTLIHEGILEYAHESGLGVYRVCEWIFLFAAGITTAYMLKLYVALFWKRHPARQADFDAKNGRYMNRLSAFALAASAVWIPVLGLRPAILEGLARRSAGFTGIEGVAGIRYFSLENLRGGGVSLLIGALVYLFAVRNGLIDRIALPRPDWRGLARPLMAVVDRLCAAFDRAAENRFTLQLLPSAATALFRGLEHIVENRFVRETVPNAASAFFRALSGVVDGAALLLKRTLFRRNSRNIYRKHDAYRVFSSIVGHILDAFVFLLNVTVYRKHPIDIDFTYVLAARVYDTDPEYRRITRSVSFGLLLLSGGLLLTMLYLLVVQ